MSRTNKQQNQGSRPRLLVIGRLLKEQGNGRREKVADELRAFSRNGFAIDCLTLDDATPDILHKYRSELSGIVDNWYVWQDPVLNTVRFIVRKLLVSNNQNGDDTGRRRLRPKIRQDRLINILFSLPDPIIGWYIFNRNRLRQLHKIRKYSYIYSISSPHCFQLAGRYLKQRNQDLIWIMSFRDPWSEFPLQHPGRLITSFNERAEYSCLKICDLVLLYKGWFPGGRCAYINKFGKQIEYKVIESPYIGCDERSIDRITNDMQPESGNSKNELRFVHLGTLYGDDHNEQPFLQALAEYLEKQDETKHDVQVTFIGGTSPNINDFLGRLSILKNHITIKRYLPYDEAITEVTRADVALWFQAERGHYYDNVPAKVFEYAYLKLPILAVSASSDSYRILEKYKLGWTYSASDIKGIMKAIEHFSNTKKTGESFRRKGTNPFPRKKFIDWFEHNVVQKAKAIKITMNMA